MIEFQPNHTSSGIISNGEIWVIVYFLTRWSRIWPHNVLLHTAQYRIVFSQVISSSCRGALCSANICQALSYMSARELGSCRGTSSRMLPLGSRIKSTLFHIFQSCESWTDLCYCGVPILLYWYWSLNFKFPYESNKSNDVQKALCECWIIFWGRIFLLNIISHADGCFKYTLSLNPKLFKLWDIPAVLENATQVFNHLPQSLNDIRKHVF